MMKAGWSLCHQKNELWASVIRSKYKCGSDIIPRIQRNRAGSNFWRGVCKSWEQVQQNFTWRLGDGKRIHFWNDHWVMGSSVLRDEASNPLSLVDSFKSVSDYYDQRAGWNIQLLKNLLPTSITDKIRAMHGPMISGGDDTLAWKLTPDGCFSMCSAVSFLQGTCDGNKSRIFTSIWHWKCPKRIKMHLWKLASEGLLTNVARAHRGLAQSPDCPTCMGNLESVVHVSQDCTFARDLWNMRLGSMTHQSFFSLNLHDWLLDKLHKSRHKRPPLWNSTFAVALDCLWQIRNERMFNNKSTTVES